LQMLESVLESILANYDVGTGNVFGVGAGFGEGEEAGVGDDIGGFGAGGGAEVEAWVGPARAPGALESVKVSPPLPSMAASKSSPRRSSASQAASFESCGKTAAIWMTASVRSRLMARGAPLGLSAAGS
jgi:hypothetical protein